MGELVRVMKMAGAGVILLGWMAGQLRAEGVNAGTAGRELGGVKVSGRETIAIVGDLSPVNEVSGKYLKGAVGQLNLLRPDAVFCVGNLVEGMTRNEETYAKEVVEVRGVLDGLKMGWYPCVGRHDVVSGTREAGDRRYEGMYEKYFGPLYYSVNVGEVHVVVLDSEEGVGAGSAISEGQLEWLKGDLNKTFEGRKSAYVVVVVHRPLWGEKEGNWDRVHEMLVEFNRRPIVSVEGVEGVGGGAGAMGGPRVVGVYAGSARGYAQEPTRDGIRYTVVGATAARIDQDAAEMVRGMMVIKFDGEEGGVHAAVVETAGRMGASEGGPVVGEDVVTRRERDVLDGIAGLPKEVMGVEGMIEQGGGVVTVRAGNPLAVAVDIELRMASAANLGSETERENANEYAESFDAPWELGTPHLIRHLDAGAKEEWQVRLTNLKGEEAVAPPQVEFVVHWADPRGRMHTVVLKRKVAVSPAAELTAMSGTVGAKGAFVEGKYVSGGTTAWVLRGDEPRERGGEWDMAADGENVYVRVRVEKGEVRSYWPRMELGEKWGGLASDAVWVGWEEAGGGVKRVWAVPFGPKGLELWMNEGVGSGETKLVRMEEKVGVKGEVKADEKGYEVVLTMPRKVVFWGGTGGRMNIGVNENEEGAWSWQRSWAAENWEGAGAKGWGMVRVK